MPPTTTTSSAERRTPAPRKRAAASKPRTMLVLPFAAVDLTRDEQWIGEGAAQAARVPEARLNGDAERRL